MPFKDIEKRREASRKWRRQNKKKFYAYIVEYRALNPEKVALWTKRSVERQKLKNTVFSAEQRERRNAACEAWKKRNPEAFKDMLRASRHARRGAEGRWTRQEWKQLKEKYDHRCLCCKRSEEDLTAVGLKLVPDHVQALSRGGRNDIHNLQPLCHGADGCNNRKGTKHIDYRPK